MRLNLYLTFSAILMVTGLSAQISTATTTATNAVQNVLLGNGVTASNITYTGYVNGIATFTATPSTNLGIGSGVYLTSGSLFQNDPNLGSTGGQDGPAGPASNHQSVDQTGAGATGAGDANLNTISNATTWDAAVLEFDFVPQSDTIKFKYTFGSEEYNDYVNSGYNDVFGFFLTGQNPSGGNYTNSNIALIPGTTTIVSIDNVNNGSSGGLGTGPCVNCSYYRDNFNGAAGINGCYDGYTVVMEARAAVVCGATYHIKLAVADAGDHIFDSGVFLEAGSFTTSAPITVTSAIQSSTNDSVLYEGCSSASIYFIRPTTMSSSADTITYTITGTATNGTDYTQINDTIFFAPGQDSVILSLSAAADGIAEGVESVTLSLTQTINVCGLQQTITFDIYIADPPLLTLAVNDTAVCNGTSIVLDPDANGGVGGPIYNWSTGGSTISTDSTLTVNPSSTTNYIVNVSDICGQTLTDTITVDVPLVNYFLASVDVVGNSFDTLIIEGCDTLIVTFTRGGNNLGIAETYSYGVTGTATNGTDYLPSLSGSVSFASGVTTQTVVITAPADGLPEGLETLILTISADTANPCALQQDLQIVVYINELQPMNVAVNDTTICPGQNVTLTAAASGGDGNYSYTWNQSLGNGAVKNVTPTVTTEYIVTATHSCGTDSDTDTATVTVLQGTPTIAPLSDIISCPGAAQNVNTFVGGGNAPYVMAWTYISPDTIIMNNSLLSTIPSANYGGIYILSVTDKCNKTDSDTMTVVVDDCSLVTPNIVTPNGDGKNDALYFSNLEKYPNSSLLVYDRWGIKIFESSNYNNAWVPEVSDGVYFYILGVSDGRTISSYFHVFRQK